MYTMVERRERITERGCERQNEDKGRKRKIGEREGGEWERNREERWGAQANTISLGHFPGLIDEHRDNKHQVLVL